jgi:hypothetical protein
VANGAFEHGMALVNHNSNLFLPAGNSNDGLTGHQLLDVLLAMTTN